MLGLRGLLAKARRSNPATAVDAGNGQQWTIGGGWGDRIEWFAGYKLGSATQRVCGWKPTKPKCGDMLLCPMQSGQTGLWKFTEIEPCDDPPDMFFATVEAIGYAEDKR